jgi:hypothetical protein
MKLLQAAVAGFVAGATIGGGLALAIPHPVGLVVGNDMSVEEYYIREFLGWESIYMGNTNYGGNYDDYLLEQFKGMDVWKPKTVPIFNPWGKGTVTGF